MNLNIIGRVAGIAVLTAGLAGCIDMTTEVEVLSETSGKATTITVMGAEFYPLIKSMSQMTPPAVEGAPAPAQTESFCDEEGATLVENADMSATCTTITEGEFASLSDVEGATENAAFTVVSPGVVRVTFKTEGLQEQASEGQDPEAAAMMMAYFDGHFATLRVKGKKVVDTNMTLSADGTSAEIVIPFTELMAGTAELPEELYAVVDTN